MNDIEILEEILNRQIEDTEGTKIMKQAIENLINRVKELEEENKYLKKQIPIDKIFYYSDKDYIPKSKIKEKRDKLIEVHKERDFTNKEAYYLDCYNELLKEQEDK